MRIGKWAPLYNRMLSIPRQLATSFGFNEGSELYFVPLGDATTDRKHGCEIMVSPIPVSSWP
ncbi:MAG TPA: AbrB/MazE/SpoVT family DNA-binding domain-containing protein, partial [Thermoanaerobaculia bacterium]|nr:AbrB/MazE/SpoVT family DNA-binding domain-containing protein [Thermoanaerobaculia bacterium]